MKSLPDFVLESSDCMTNPYWIDSHAHLASDELFENFDSLIENARAMNVRKINIICGTLHDIERMLPKIENNPMFDISLGVHPMEVQDVSQEELQAMRAYYSHPSVVCVGEIGLDYYWDDQYKDLQKLMLKNHIALANEFDLPIAIHLRDKKDATQAVDDLIAILQAHDVKRKGVIHCYSDTVDNAKIFLNMGYYLGIGGVVTFKNGDNVRDVIAIAPLDRLVSETDSPFLAPVPMRGKRNQPAYVSYVGAYLNNLYGQDTQQQLMENYYTLYHKSKRL